MFAPDRTLMMEDRVQLSDDPRIARLYLPFADDAGRVVGLAVAIIKVA